MMMRGVRRRVEEDGLWGGSGEQLREVGLGAE